MVVGGGDQEVGHTTAIFYFFFNNIFLRDVKLVFQLWGVYEVSSLLYGANYTSTTCTQ